MSGAEKDVRAILDRACQRLADLERDEPMRLWEAAKHVSVTVPSESGALTRFNAVYTTAEALRRGIEQREGAFSSGAIALLTEIDRPRAAAFAADLLRAADLAKAHPSSLEGSLARVMGAVFAVLVDHVDPSALRDLWLLGRVRMNVLSDAAIAQTPIADLARACRETRALDLDPDRLLALHPGLGSGAAAAELCGALQGSSHFYLIASLLDRIAELRYAPAIPVLMSYVKGADARHHRVAAKALLAIGTPEAHASLAELLDTAPAGALHAAAEASLRLDPSNSAARLSPRLSEERLASPGVVGPGGLDIARAIVGAPVELLKQDPRWIELLAGKLHDPRFGVRSVLAHFDLVRVEEAVRRAPQPIARSLPKLPQAPRWLDRYLAGEREAVWEEICALEGAIRDPSLLPEAEAVARAIMSRVRENLARVVKVLKKGGYELRIGASKALATVSPKTTARRVDQLEKMEKLLGGPLPIAVRAFYEIVGGVNLQEAVDPGYDDETAFSDLGQYEALSIASVQEMSAQLEQDAEGERAYPPFLRRRPSELYLAADPMFKQWPDEYGNDHPAYLTFADPAGADGLVVLPVRRAAEGEPAAPPEEVSFVDYLRRYIARGGFLWLIPAERPDSETAIALSALSHGHTPF